MSLGDASTPYQDPSFTVDAQAVIFHSGEAEYKAAQAKGYAEGLQDQVTGYVQRIYLGLVHRLTNPCSYVKNIGGALTGDNTQQAEGESLSPAQLMTG